LKYRTIQWGNLQRCPKGRAFPKGMQSVSNSTVGYVLNLTKTLFRFKSPTLHKGSEDIQVKLANLGFSKDGFQFLR
jgi:hypothetical protein